MPRHKDRNSATRDIAFVCMNLMMISLINGADLNDQNRIQPCTRHVSSILLLGVWLIAVPSALLCSSSGGRNDPTVLYLRILDQYTFILQVNVTEMAQRTCTYGCSVMSSSAQRRIIDLVLAVFACSGSIWVVGFILSGQVRLRNTWTSLPVTYHQFLQCLV